MTSFFKTVSFLVTSVLSSSLFSIIYYEYFFLYLLNNFPSIMGVSLAARFFSIVVVSIIYTFILNFFLSMLMKTFEISCLEKYGFHCKLAEEGECPHSSLLTDASVKREGHLRTGALEGADEYIKIQDFLYHIIGGKACSFFFFLAFFLSIFTFTIKNDHGVYCFRWPNRHVGRTTLRVDASCDVDKHSVLAPAHTCSSRHYPKIFTV